jgi:malate synthase
MNDGRPVDAALVRRALAEQTEKLKNEMGAARFAASRYGEASGILEKLMTAPEFREFLTLATYDSID